ncbi:DNA replication ATP-dependent helicase/nuclease DNA2-like [Elysia marginata]|uniref:DNA replication ATP-dependent helicase/nuclease DNA2-like n=1 Tax=Elysia marginata TaxID=1093978 RepID=A0AAV4JIX0_9GAST|nr:DNA replication ATP-dependent helicase/nuclease DNA2-like [Elysia marginata]
MSETRTVKTYVLLSFQKEQLGQKESALFTRINSEKSNPKSCLEQRHREDHNVRKQLLKSVVKDTHKDETSSSTNDNKENNEDKDEEVLLVSCDGLQETQMDPHPAVNKLDSLTSICKELKLMQKRNNCHKQNLIMPQKTTNSNLENEGSSLSCIDLDLEASRKAFELPLSESVIATPDKKHQNKTMSDLSPDVICDTPGVDRELQESRMRRRKLYASRSFLCSADLVSVQPGLKPAHLRAQRKARPSKLLGKVSVTINTNNKSRSGPSAASSSSLNSVTDVTDIVDQQRSSMVTNDVLDSERCDQGRNVISFRSTDQSTVCGQPHSIPETQLTEGRTDAQSTKARTEIDQCSSDEDGQPDHVFDQSAKELDKTVDKYLCAMESLESADIDADSTGSKNRGADKSKFSPKSTKWDRIKIKDSKESNVYGPASSHPESRNLNVKSKLIGALETAEVRAKEEEGKTWLKQRIMNDILQGDSSSSTSKETTPVKIYPGKTLTVKRLAKPGASPLSKRTHSSDFPSEEQALWGHFDDFQITSQAKKVLNYDSNPAKIYSKRCHKFTRQRALEFGLRPKDLNCDAGGSVTLKDDRLLADLLVDLNSQAGNTNPDSDKVNLAEHIIRNRAEKSTSLRIKNFKDAKVFKEDKKLLDLLFGESFIDVDDGLEENSVATSLPKSEQMEPILIEDSENPAVTDNEGCIVVEEDLENLENEVSALISVGEKKGTSFNMFDNSLDAGLGENEIEKNTVNPEESSSIERPKNRSERNSGLSASDENSSNNSLGFLSNRLQPSCQGDHLAVTLKSNTSKSADKGSNGDQLSTSLCDMLSESFDDEFLAPKPLLSEEMQKEKQDFVFTDLWNRFSVQEVKYQRETDELLLDVSCQRSHETRECVLRGFWVDTEVKKGDIVNVLADLDHGRYIVDDRKGLVIVNPDILLSGTLVVSGVFCPRKSVLNEQFKGVDQGNIQMLYGSIIHSLFQEVLRDSVTEEKDVEALAVSRLKSSKFLHEMYGRKLVESTVLDEVKQYIPSLISWIHKHTSVSQGRGRNSRSEQKFGLKGKIDLTVEAKVTKANTSTGTEVKVLPLELKTGKASFSSEHKGQVTLYSMMCSDRQADPQEGILLYLKQEQMQTIPVKPESKSGKFVEKLSCLTSQT